MKYDHEWIAARREDGLTWPEVAAAYEYDAGVVTGGKQLRQAHSRWRKRQGPEAATRRSVGSRPEPEAPAPRRPKPEIRPAILDELQSYVHPAPFEVTYPRVPAPRDADIITGVLYGDTHGQYIDEEAEAVLLAVLRDMQPDAVVHVGDAVDCYTISSFDKDPSRKEDLQSEIDHARRHLAQVRAVVPDAHFRLLEGNHEDRLRRAIWGSERAMRQIVTLRVFQEAVTWPNLLQLDDLGIEWVPSNAQPVQDLFPKFILKHGTVVRKWSGWSAKGEWERYGKSGASGHTHRLGTFFHRDWNGNHVWVETGCLCDLDPDYVRDPDWQNGFVVASFERTTGAFQIEPVYIHRGRAVWRGREYRA